MICERCGGEVTWRGPLIALTHAQCGKCGGINCQIPEDEPPADESDTDQPESEGESE